MDGTKAAQSRAEATQNKAVQGATKLAVQVAAQLKKAETAATTADQAAKRAAEVAKEQDSKAKEQELELTRARRAANLAAFADTRAKCTAEGITSCSSGIRDHVACSYTHTERGPHSSAMPWCNAVRGSNEMGWNLVMCTP